MHSESRSGEARVSAGSELACVLPWGRVAERPTHVGPRRLTSGSIDVAGVSSEGRSDFERAVLVARSGERVPNHRRETVTDNVVRIVELDSGREIARTDAIQAMGADGAVRVEKICLALRATSHLAPCSEIARANKSPWIWSPAAPASMGTQGT